MENIRMKLPVGIQTFERLRTDGYVYIDKTNYLVNLIESGNPCFLARPRRFGKSLTVSTFDALFSGRKELFKGLAAEAFMNRPDYHSNPVIRLDMSKVSTDNGINVLKESIKQITLEVADNLEVDVPIKLPSSDILRNLIANTAKKYNQKVVILLDEYDKPYTDFVNDTDMAEKVRLTLRNYYSQVKASDEHIRFIFITGISKFARFGVFSTLNNLTDISMMPEFAEICGYTEEEIIRYFPDYMKETAGEMGISTDELIERMRHYYNGFSFDRNADVRLYNPFSTLLFFREKEFANYWIESGSPKFIADYMKNRNLMVEQFRNFPVTKGFARSPGDMDSTPPEGFLYQSGYLTIRKGIGDSLALDYPNTEVLNSMSALVAQNIFTGKGENYTYNIQRIFAALQADNYELFIGALNTLLASIPYDDFLKAAEQNVIIQGYTFPAQEWLYRSNIFSFLQGCGIVAAAEMHTSRGRPDLVITFLQRTWVIEFKVAYEGESAEKKAEEALRQIRDKGYAMPYPNAICLGLGIDNAARQITASQIVMR